MIDSNTAYLFRSECLWCAKVLAVIVTQMVVTDNGLRFDTRANQKVDEYRLQLGLSRLEIISGNEHLPLVCKLEYTGYEGVLWRSVNISYLNETDRNHWYWKTRV